MIDTKDCNTCKFHEQGAHPTLVPGCFDCLNSAALPGWGAKHGTTSDGTTADYYVVPAGVSELQDLISHRDMNAQMGEIFRACYRYGQEHHSPKLRDIKKVLYYAKAELKRLEKLAE